VRRRAGRRLRASLLDDVVGASRRLFQRRLDLAFAEIDALHGRDRDVGDLLPPGITGAKRASGRRSVKTFRSGSLAKCGSCASAWVTGRKPSFFGESDPLFRLEQEVEEVQASSLFSEFWNMMMESVTP
jgi:hypothetical protein